MKAVFPWDKPGVFVPLCPTKTDPIRRNWIRFQRKPVGYTSDSQDAQGRNTRLAHLQFVWPAAKMRARGASTAILRVAESQPLVLNL